MHAALRAGHEVTLFHRGRFSADAFPDAEHRIGDRDTNLDPLLTGSWDATIDMCAYFPRQVHALAEVLQNRAGRYTFISSVSAYSPAVATGYSEDAPLAELDDPTTEELTDSTYGGLKVLCERATVARFGGDSLIVRPTYVIGPHDVSWRFPRWVMRLASGGNVLAPGPPDDPCQVIDARDLAAWIVSMNEQGRGGVFHAVGPQHPITWRQLLEAVAQSVAPAGTVLSWVNCGFLLGEGVTDVDLPLWPGAEPVTAMLTAHPNAAITAGLRFRPLSETVADTLVWARMNKPDVVRSLTADREADLLARWYRLGPS